MLTAVSAVSAATQAVAAKNFKRFIVIVLNDRGRGIAVLQPTSVAAAG